MQLLSPRDLRTQETKHNIYEATKQILQNYGFKYVTVRNVCEEAQVTQGAFYYHFDSKQSLLSEYGREVFLNMRQENPLPEKIDPADYVKVINWHLHVYCLYCDRMGQKFIKHHLDNCKKDIFYETSFSECILEPVRQAIEAGYFTLPQGEEKAFLPAFAEDMETIYTGIVRCWSHQTFEENGLDKLEGLMYRIVMRFLYTFSTEAYRQEYTMRDETVPDAPRDFSKRFESYHKTQKSN